MTHNIRPELVAELQASDAVAELERMAAQGRWSMTDKALLRSVLGLDVAQEAIERALKAHGRLKMRPTRSSIREIACGFFGEVVDVQLDRMLARARDGRMGGAR